MGRSSLHPSFFCDCKSCKRDKANFDRQEERKRNARSGNSGRSSNRRFPANNGTVDGRPGYVQQSGDRTVAYSGPDNVGKVVSNDGVNADYVRNDDGTPVVDNQSPDPYNPEPWNSH